jgi:glycosyltransferase involved in cell wall biosynthesis
MEKIPARAASKALYRTLEQLQPDVLFSGAIAYPSGATAVRWARKSRKPLVVFDDARQGDVPRSRLVNWVKRRIYGNVDGLLIPAPSHQPDYGAWGVSPSRMFYGLNAVDNDAWATRAVEALSNAGATRSRWELPGRYFLAVGRQVPKKNFTRLIHAYGTYRASRGDNALDLVMVGDGPERTTLEALVRESGICGVHFHPFRKPGELGAYYALAKALILPSASGETWGLVVNEAMACGLPVLVSRECGCAQTLVHEGCNGWTFGPLDPEALANLMARFEQQGDPEHSAMGEASRRIVAQWGLDGFVQGVQAAIEAVRGTHRGFASTLDRMILTAWNGRYRPT